MPIPTNLATAFVRVRADTAGFSSELAAGLQGSGVTAAREGEKAGVSYGENLKNHLSKAFTQVAKMGAVAFAGIAVASVDMAAKFDQAMTRLQTQAGVSAKQLVVLKAGVLGLAQQVGFSASLADSLYHVESNFQSMGITSSKALALVKIAAEGAAVGGADLTDVTNALTAMIASGIPGVKNFSDAMGTLNTIVGAGDMKMQDLAEAFGGGMVATVKGFGLSIQDVGAALDVFGDNNIRGARAGTQLRMSVMALASPAKAGAEQLIAWGKSADSLAVDMEHGGLMKALMDLHGLFVKNGVTAKEQGRVITEMFGKRAGAGLNVLMDQLTRLKSKFVELAPAASIAWLNVSGGMAHVIERFDPAPFDKLGQAWKTQSELAAQKAKDLRAAIDSIAISIGEKLLPPLKDAAGWLLKGGHLMDVLKVSAGVLAAVMTAKLVVGLVEFAKAVKIATAVQWLWNVALDANPISAIIVLIAGLVVAFIYAYNHFKWFRDFIQAAWRDIKAAFEASIRFVVNAFLGMVGAIIHGAADAFGWIPGLGPKLKAAAAAFDRFRASVNAALGGIHNRTVSVTAVLGFTAPGNTPGSSGPGVGPPKGPAGSGTPQAYAASQLSGYGWGQGQFAPLNSLWTRESGWQWNATNPSSGAYGIPQSLPASKMASAGADWRTNPDTQIRWGLGYIAGTYGSPSGAWAHEVSAGWYDRGGYLPTGLSLALNTTGRPEPVGGGGGVHYHINVGVLPGGERQAGALIVEKIKAFEQGSGHGWRK